MHKFIIIILSLLLGFVTFMIPVISEWIQNSVFWLIVIILLSYSYKNKNNNNQSK